MKIRDFILILAILLAALLIFLFQTSGKREGSWAVVEINGVETGRYSLGCDGEFALNGGTNILTISEGKASVSEADCPDKLCVKQGKIKYTGQCITCLPNKLTVKIEGGEKGVDFVL